MDKIHLRDRLIDLERKLVVDALRATRGDVRAAARLLTMPERTLWRRLKGTLNLDATRLELASLAKMAKVNLV